MFRYFVFISVTLLFFSCGKEKIVKTPQDSAINKVVESDEDTVSLSPQESFGLTLVQDILQDDKETDLQLYLEESVYPIVSKSSKVTIDRITSSVYLLKYFDGTTEKNIYIQKFYNPQTDEIDFEKSDIKPSFVNPK